MTTPPYRWTFYRSGGVDQVALQSAEDLIHLRELDPKLWIALSMPIRGTSIEARTLELLDTDQDGHIRQPEVLAAIAWTNEVYKDLGRLLQGGDAIPLDALRDGPVLAGARRLLANLGKPDATEVSLADATSAEEMFAGTLFNGDGVIPPECAEGDLRGVITDILTTHGSIPDRSGKPGIDQPRIDAFFAEAEALLAWHARADAAVLPLGDATAAAADAVRVVRAKIDDYFTRGRLAAFDARAAGALNANDAELAALSARQLSAETTEIASLPIARIEAGAALPLADGVNPAWQARLAALATAAVIPMLGPRGALTEADWRRMLGELAAYEAWRDARPANTASALGIDRLRAIVGAPGHATDHKAALGKLIEHDLALKPELDSVVDVEKLCRYQRDLSKLLHNYVNFSEFYTRKGAVFEVGTLYLDGRGCHLVVEVADVGKHGTMAPMAGVYLAYCECVRPGEKKVIAAAFTAGDVDNLMVGRNGVFVDRLGRDWEATIVKVIENPISIRLAFWSPYKKLVRMIEERVAKRAAKADAAANSRLEHTADEAADAENVPRHLPPPEPADAADPVKIDVGTIAALGVAIGGIGAFGTAVMAAMFGLGWWMPLGVFGIMLAISGPAMALAFIKLRRRNLGPLLDANGWAINLLTRINVPFGAALTDVAALPPGARRSATDPYAEKRRPWRLYITVVVVLLLAFAWFFGKLDGYLPRPLRSTSILGDLAPAYADVPAEAPPPAAPAHAEEAPPAEPRHAEKPAPAASPPRRKVSTSRK
jgi:hypothetical protein